MVLELLHCLNVEGSGTVGTYLAVQNFDLGRIGAVGSCVKVETGSDSGSIIGCFKLSNFKDSCLPCCWEVIVICLRFFVHQLYYFEAISPVSFYSNGFKRHGFDYQISFAVIYFISPRWRYYLE